MATTFVKGDIFDTTGIRTYAMGGNVAGTMDAGIAIAFKKRWPKMYEAYKERCAKNGLQLGDVFEWADGDETVYVLALQTTETAKSKMAVLSRAAPTMKWTTSFCSSVIVL